MDFKEFKETIKSEIPDYLLGYDIDRIELENVKKNNGVEMTGLSIMLKNERISPNIYLEYFYEKYRENGDMGAILNEIKDEYIKAREEISQKGFDVDFKKEDIFMKVVNYEYNKEMFEYSPYIRVAPDLAISFRVLANKDDDGIASTLLTYDLLEKMELSKSEVYELAKENTERLFPARVERLSDILQGMEIDTTGMPSESMLYVVTNNAGVNGATAMCYENILKDFKEQYGDFYILPSSIHEVLLLKMSKVQEGDLPEIKQMVKEINEFTVSPMEKLSDNVYEYDEKSNEIIIAGEQRHREDFMER